VARHAVAPCGSSYGEGQVTSGDHDDQIEAINIAAELAAPAQDVGALGACVIAGGSWLFGLCHEAAVRGCWRTSEPSCRHSEVLQLREELMEGSPQPTRIVGTRPRRGGPMEGARDRVLDGACGHLYYRVTTVV